MLAVTSEAFGHRFVSVHAQPSDVWTAAFHHASLFKQSSFQHFISFDHFEGVAKMVLRALYQFFDHGLKLRLLPRA